MDGRSTRLNTPFPVQIVWQKSLVWLKFWENSDCLKNQCSLIFKQHWFLNKIHYFLKILESFKSQNIVFDPGFGISVKFWPRMRSSYAFITVLKLKAAKKGFLFKNQYFGRKSRFYRNYGSESATKQGLKSSQFIEPAGFAFLYWKNAKIFFFLIFCLKINVV